MNFPPNGRLLLRHLNYDAPSETLMSIWALNGATHYDKRTAAPDAGAIGHL